MHDPSIEVKDAKREARRAFPDVTHTSALDAHARRKGHASWPCYAKTLEMAADVPRMARAAWACRIEEALDAIEAVAIAGIPAGLEIGWNHWTIETMDIRERSKPGIAPAGPVIAELRRRPDVARANAFAMAILQGRPVLPGPNGLAAYDAMIQPTWEMGIPGAAIHLRFHGGLRWTSRRERGRCVHAMHDTEGSIPHDAMGQHAKFMSRGLEQHCAFVASPFDPLMWGFELSNRVPWGEVRPHGAVEAMLMGYRKAAQIPLGSSLVPPDRALRP